MKYETFEAQFISQNIKLRLILGVSIFLMVINTSILLLDKKYFILKNSKLVNSRPLLTWACEEAFVSISKKTPFKDLIEDSILNELKKNEFKVNAEEVLSVLSLKENVCRIIVKGEGKVRSFLVNFKTDSSYPFYFKLSEINETEINLSEIALTKDTL